MTTATADATLLDAARPAPASAPLPTPVPAAAPELHADRSTRLILEPQAEPAAFLQAEPPHRFKPEPESQPMPSAVLEAEPSQRLMIEPEPIASVPLQADPSQRLITEPVVPVEAEPAYAPAPRPVREAGAPVQRKSWSEQRAERRRRRVWLEEVLGWILVPVIVLGTWWFIEIVLTALGTSPAAILNGLSAITSAL